LFGLKHLLVLLDTKGFVHESNPPLPKNLYPTAIPDPRGNSSVMATRIVPIMSAPEAFAPNPVSQSPESIISQMDKGPVQTTALLPRRVVTGTSVRMTIPLDAASRSLYPERKIARRDSMERREALLKGKEGSRQRRRWENGTFTRAPSTDNYGLICRYVRSPPFQSVGGTSSPF
jgi:hypothetical protein